MKNRAIYRIDRTDRRGGDDIPETIRGRPRRMCAALADSTFTDEALALHTEELVARRDELVRIFGLTEEVPLRGPNGPDTHPPPRDHGP